MYKRLLVIIVMSGIILSLTACGNNNSTAPSGNKTESDFTASGSTIDKSTNKNNMSIAIQQEGDNTAIICEGDLVNEFSDIAKADKDAQFLVEFEANKDDKTHTKGFSLSFKLDDEPFALYHNSGTHKGYSNDNEDIMAFNVNDGKVTWTLKGIDLPLDGVETVSIWLVSGDNDPIGEHFEMPIADVQMENDVDSGSEEDPNNSSTVQGKAPAYYVGTYLPEDEQGYQCVVVVEENKLTIDGRYVVEFPVEDPSVNIQWSGIMTDTETGETCDAFLNLYSCQPPILLLHTYIDSKDIFIQSIKE